MDNKILEVGHDPDSREVIVNHPDLKRDERGIAHIVFSVEQARNFAQSVLKHAQLAEGSTACGRCGYVRTVWAVCPNGCDTSESLGAV